MGISRIVAIILLAATIGRAAAFIIPGVGELFQNEFSGKVVYRGTYSGTALANNKRNARPMDLNGTIKITMEIKDQKIVGRYETTGPTLPAKFTGILKDGRCTIYAPPDPNPISGPCGKEGFTASEKLSGDYSGEWFIEASTVSIEQPPEPQPATAGRPTTEVNQQASGSNLSSQPQVVTPKQAEQTSNAPASNSVQPQPIRATATTPVIAGGADFKGLTAAQVTDLLKRLHRRIKQNKFTLLQLGIPEDIETESIWATVEAHFPTSNGLHLITGKSSIAERYILVVEDGAPVAVTFPEFRSYDSVPYLRVYGWLVGDGRVVPEPTQSKVLSIGRDILRFFNDQKELRATKRRALACISVRQIEEGKTKTRACSDSLWLDGRPVPSCSSSIAWQVSAGSDDFTELSNNCGRTVKVDIVCRHGIAQDVTLTKGQTYSTKSISTSDNSCAAYVIDK